MIRARLDRCGGDYTLLVSADSRVTLLTGDGKRFTEAEISPEILTRSGRAVDHADTFDQKA
jgi:hypothetical protein